MNQLLAQIDADLKSARNVVLYAKGKFQLGYSEGVVAGLESVRSLVEESIKKASGDDGGALLDDVVQRVHLVDADELIVGPKDGEDHEGR